MRSPSLRGSLDIVAGLDPQLASVAGLQPAMQELGQLREPLERVAALEAPMSRLARLLWCWIGPFCSRSGTVRAAAWGVVTFVAVRLAIISASRATRAS